MNLCIGVIYKTGNQFQTVLDPDANNGVIVRNNLSTKEMHIFLWNDIRWTLLSHKNKKHIKLLP